MLPDIWGPSMWKSIHTIAVSYPLNPTHIDKKNYKQFFKYLAKVLPCKSCSSSFRKYMKHLPIDNYLSTNKRLLYWTYLIHNKVNKKLNKHVKISWGNIRKKYIHLSLLNCKYKIPKNI